MKESSQEEEKGLDDKTEEKLLRDEKTGTGERRLEKADVQDPQLGRPLRRGGFVI